MMVLLFVVLGPNTGGIGRIGLFCLPHVLVTACEMTGTFPVRGIILREHYTVCDGFHTTTEEFVSIMQDEL